MNTIEWSRKALKQARKIPNPDRDKILSKVDELADFPNCRNVKDLTNHEYNFRLRVGNYRVLFDFDGVIKLVSIQEVKRRSERTY